MAGSTIPAANSRFPPERFLRSAPSVLFILPVINVLFDLSVLFTSFHSVLSASVLPDPVPSDPLLSEPYRLRCALQGVLQLGLCILQSLLHGLDAVYNISKLRAENGVEIAPVLHNRAVHASL